jgi:hypothetical protein
MYVRIEMNIGFWEENMKEMTLKTAAQMDV